MNYENEFLCQTTISINTAKQQLCEKDEANWMNVMTNTDKLRTYQCFKNSYNTEPFAELVHNRQHRSAIAQFR